MTLSPFAVAVIAYRDRSLAELASLKDARRGASEAEAYDACEYYDVAIEGECRRVELAERHLEAVGLAGY